MIDTALISVGTDPTVLLLATNGSATSPLPWIVQNPAGGASIFVGGLTVTAATGIEVPAGEQLSGTSYISDHVAGVTASGTKNVRVLKGNQ